MLGFALVGVPLRAALTQNVVVGTVADDATGRPLAGAIARISVGDVSRVTRTDELGEFRFANVGTGRVTLTVRLLGFDPSSLQLDVSPSMQPASVRLHRLVVLDTVRVRAARQGVYGVVATASDLRPLPKATLKIVGVGGGSVPLDSTGHFFVPIHTVGSYFMRAKAPGYEPQTMSVVVAPDDGVEIAFLLDTALAGPAHRLEIAMQDFDDRIKVRGLSSVLVPRTELLAHGPSSTVMALRYARSFVEKALRLSSTACVYVDGIAKPGLSLNAIDPADIEAIEAYGSSSDRSGTLSRGWPRMAPCGDTGLPFAHSGTDLVVWVTIWLKH